MVVEQARGVLLQCALLLALVFTAPGSGCERVDRLFLTPEQEAMVKQNLLDEIPQPAHGVGALLGEEIEFIGYDLDPERPAPGQDFTITWYWRSLADVGADWKIFVHLDSAAGGSYRLNLDHHPMGGLHPVRNWRKGQIIKDVQRAKFPGTFPEGPVTVWLGLYRGDSRMAVSTGGEIKTDGANRIDAGTIELIRRAPDPDLPRVTARRATCSIEIDGVLDESCWAEAGTTGPWVTPDGRGEPRQNTRARFLWDEDNLYLAVEVEDDDIWSTFTERNSNLWEQEAIELFLDPAESGTRYVEIQVSPANVLFDAVFSSHRSDLEKARAHDLPIASAVSVDGTLNERDDVDRGWVVEMAIPFSSLPPAGETPAPGESWRMNLFRMDAPKGKRQEASAWSPPRVGDFHATHRFGHLTFQ